jgi:hypothetical protein
VLSQKLLRLVGLWADAYCLLVVLLLLGSLCAAGTESMQKLGKAVAVYEGAVSAHQLLLSGIKWSKLTGVQLLDQYAAAEVIRLAHEADSKAGEYYQYLFDVSVVQHS